MESGERPIARAEVKVEEKTEKFQRLGKASAELTGKVFSDLDAEGIPPESRLKVTAFAKNELLDEVRELDFETILTKALEKGWKIAIYNPGVAWTGDQWSKREVRDNPRYSDIIEGSISREEKSEQQKKSAALDFLAESGFDLCLTFDPAETKGFVSSLRADMLARRFAMQAVEKKVGHSGKGLLTSVSWSNGAFKEGQIHKAIFEAIANKFLGKDVGDELGVFRNEHEAVVFGSLYGKLGVDVYLGGGPTNEQELATPFKLSSEIPVVRTINKTGLGLVNWLIKKASRLPAERVPIENRLLGTRIMEMGRGTRPGKLGEDLLTIQAMTKSLFGEARLITLADTSGSVVDSSKQLLGDDLRLIYGDKVIMVETHQEKPLPRLPEEKEFSAFSPAQHGELKRYGVLQSLKRIVREKRDGTFNQAKNEQERFVVVVPGATEFTQKKGTKLRLNPLPQLGRV